MKPQELTAIVIETITSMRAGGEVDDANVDRIVRLSRDDLIDLYAVTTGMLGAGIDALVQLTDADWDEFLQALAVAYAAAKYPGDDGPEVTT